MPAENPPFSITGIGVQLRRNTQAVRAIDEFFKELQPMVNRALVLGEPELRASCVLVEGGGKT